MSQTLRLDSKHIEIDATGNPILIGNHEKLLQDLQTIVLTPLRGHFAHADFGCELENMIVMPLDDNAEARMQWAIEEAAARLQDLQRVQSRYQPVTTGEVLQQVDDITASLVEDKPTGIIVAVSVVAGDQTVEEAAWEVAT